MPSSLDTCPRCSQRSDSDTFCSRCGSSLLVDLLLQSFGGDERARYLAAKELAALPLPGHTLVTLKQALAGPVGSVLARRLGRRIAGQALEVLARHDGSGAVRPSPERSSRALVLALAGAALLALALGFALWPRGEAPATGGEPPDPGVPAPTDSAPPAEPPPAAVAAQPAALSTDQLAMQIRGAVAEVSCQGRLGTAFFVEPDRLATNAHVACGLDQQVQVKLADGRTLAGRTVVWEPRPDLALLEVSGAGATPLELGDSTALAVGEPVVFVGSPRGLTATVHEGKVSFVGRNLMGNAYLQVDGNVNPGNSGGPLVDRRGRAVGIITLKVLGGDGIGLALPIEYLEPHLRTAPPAEDARARWRAILERCLDEDRRELEAFRSRFARPSLVFAEATGPDHLQGVVVERWSGEPRRRELRVMSRGAGRALCIAEGTVEQWFKLEDALRQSLARAGDDLRLAWLVERHAAQDLYAGSLKLRVDHCSGEAASAEAVLEVEDGEPADTPVHFPKWSGYRSRGPLPGYSAGQGGLPPGPAYR
ncbi:MAG TPA: S1C family serine protease [Myxococcota bacterium]|nr:S1C family serine protease [Myxococcota bacterium]HRY92802.1 S1C family serine protease [Myxococcota bacterium]HSA19822.1 S1C family serine protease [Myxococcota bacterium]